MESPISSAGYQIKKMDLNTGETTLIGEPVYNGRSVQMLAVSDSGSIVLMTDFNGNASNLTVLDADGNLTEEEVKAPVAPKRRFR